MQSILAFGDSNTRGYMAGTGGRYPRGQRWCYLLERLLGPRVPVVEEGLNGRTTVFDEPLRSLRSGAAVLPMLLEAHAPLAAVVIMLGTNDCKTVHRAAPEQSAAGLERLARMVLDSEAGVDGAAPLLLLVAPAPIGGMPAEVATEYRGGAAKSAALAPLYAEVASRLGCEFVDAGQYLAPDPVDGVHLDAEGHRRLAGALAPVLLRMLACAPSLRPPRSRTPPAGSRPPAA